jgi:hypothetical protein
MKQVISRYSGVLLGCAALAALFCGVSFIEPALSAWDRTGVEYDFLFWHTVWRWAYDCGCLLMFVIAWLLARRLLKLLRDGSNPTLLQRISVWVIIVTLFCMPLVTCLLTLFDVWEITISSLFDIENRPIVMVPIAVLLLFVIFVFLCLLAKSGKWRLAIMSILSFCVIVFGLLSGWIYYFNHLGIRETVAINDNLYVVHYTYGKSCFVFDDPVEGLSSDSYDYIFKPDKLSHQRSIITMRDSLYGYYSIENGVEIYPQYLYAWTDDPESGLAACVDKDGKLGFVNVITGEVAIPHQFGIVGNNLDYDERFEDGFYAYRNFETGMYGLIDTAGTEWLLPVFDEIQYNKSLQVFKIYYEGKCGLLDKNMHEIIPLEYIGIETGIYHIAQNYTERVYYSRKGKILNRLPTYNKTESSTRGTPLYEPSAVYTASFITEEEEVNYLSLTLNGKKAPYFQISNGYEYGVVDANRNVIIPVQYEKIEYLGNGYFSCDNVIINSKGEHIE